MLVKNFYLNDIKKYELEHEISVLSLFRNMSITNVVGLIQLGNNMCSEEEACGILDINLETKNMIDIIIEIKEALLGKETKDEKNDGTINIEKYDSLTSVYTDFCMQLMSIGISFGEFWNLTARDMYRIFESLKIKLQMDINRQHSLNHTLASMIGGAVWGKLPEEAPQVSFKDKDTVSLPDDNEIDTITYKSVLNLKSFMKANKKKEV